MKLSATFALALSFAVGTTATAPTDQVVLSQLNATLVHVCDAWADQKIIIVDESKTSTTFATAKMLGTGESQNGCAYKATTDSGKIVVAKTPKRGVREGGSGYKKYTDEKKGLDVIHELVASGKVTANGVDNGQLWLLMEYHAGVHVTKTVAFQTAISEKEATCREAFPHADDDGRWSTGSLFSPFVPEAFQRYYKFDSIYHQEVTPGNSIWREDGKYIYFIDWENWSYKAGIKNWDALMVENAKTYFRDYSGANCCTNPRKGLCAMV